MSQDYIKRMILPIEGSNDIRFFTKGGKPVAVGYVRVVIGERGPYIEFSQDQIMETTFFIPREQMWRINDKRAYYIECRSNDVSHVKLYYQKRPVAYADYKINMIYISPFELVSDKYPVLVEPLKKDFPSTT